MSRISPAAIAEAIAARMSELSALPFTREAVEAFLTSEVGMPVRLIEFDPETGISKGVVVTLPQPLETITMTTRLGPITTQERNHE